MKTGDLEPSGAPLKRARTSGIETRYKLSFADKNHLRISHARIFGKQDDGDSITLVPRDKIVASLYSQFNKGFSLNSYYHYQNKSKDLKFNELPVYRTMNLNFNFSPNKKDSLYLKIENLFDRNNVVNRAGTSSNDLGFKSSGIAFYLGIKIKN